VFIPVAPLIKELELPTMGEGVGEEASVCIGKY
jgi:hypothetical protein